MKNLNKMASTKGDWGRFLYENQGEVILDDETLFVTKEGNIIKKNGEVEYAVDETQIGVDNIVSESDFESMPVMEKVELLEKMLKAGGVAGLLDEEELANLKNGDPFFQELQAGFEASKNNFREVVERYRAMEAKGLDVELIAKNGKLNDKERVKAAEDLLGRELTKEQRDVLLEAHNVPQGNNVEKGLKLMRDAFTKEEAKKLMDEGLAGYDMVFMLGAGILTILVFASTAAHFAEKFEPDMSGTGGARARKLHKEFKKDQNQRRRLKQKQNRMNRKQNKR